MPGGTSRRKDVPGPSWDGVNELALAAFTAGVAGVCMAREDIFFFVTVDFVSEVFESPRKNWRQNIFWGQLR